MTTSDELLSRLRGLHPQLIDLSLGRVERLLAKLGHPERQLPPVVHVAGTNGKGSICAYLKAMLEAAGHRVCVFTSPHLMRFHERIVVPGADGGAGPITDSQLCDILARTEAANAGEPMTFFEITTAAAFLAFAETPADVLILEVGLGGRLDATNVVQKPAVCVISSISMDHMHFLGDTLEKIAFEKAGIMKRAVDCVVARQDDAVAGVIRAQARKLRVPLFEAGQQFDAFAQHGRLLYQEEDALTDLPLPALLGRHQIGNAGVAIAAAHRLRHLLPIPDDAIARGLSQVKWPGRMQRFTSGRLASLLGPGCELWLDGGHNPGAAAMIASTLADLEERSPKPLTLIVGMLQQKDAAGFFRPFRGIAQQVYTIPIPGDPNACDAGLLAHEARSEGLHAEPADSVEDAIVRSQVPNHNPTRLVICGSLHLAGHVLAAEEGLTPHLN